MNGRCRLDEWEANFATFCPWRVVANDGETADFFTVTILVPATEKSGQKQT
jgi:hypothetical protein